ncbi:protein of unknown function DUF214 [Pseudopedobacter saltans DSM 12145]|uniref:ABC transporter n=1 Tax=Pseudopedobacter saltans (strain ATCC 51119 / DSM 12145 / JCM 21818 / CCUG 39354 / LMG 10337 / NBRC 100064 / NCIMB 13643) TaxID=762903 RepID=F0S7X0_PSESL|nr:ABC transporter permease [Pseudopedobacter saltans]ADY54378.1 protein of unknown function DUF214 [Pseudopedobacter saltans DSM 12145]
MDARENIRIAIQSIKGNKLRTFLTALIIAIGLMALVGILTSIDAIKGSLNSTFSNMGANSFTIRNRGTGIRIGAGGVKPKVWPVITYREAVEFKKRFSMSTALVSVNTFASRGSTAKYEGKKTNPNISVLGADDAYLYTGGYKLASGRNFSKDEMELGINVIIIGQEVKNNLFPTENPLEKVITIGNDKFRIIGVFDKKGSSSGFGGDRLCVIPLFKARQINRSTNPTYTISVMLNNPSQMEYAIGESTALFRNIRKVEISKPDNFEITKSDSLAQTLFENLKFVQYAGIAIGFITLAGAAVALMNIMLVSVTERTREIGVRKAIGATPEIIRRQFLYEAIMICLIGGFCGIFMGILIGNILAITMGASFLIPWAWIFLGLTACIITGLLSGFIPASKAAKLDPVEALRYE